MVSLGMVGVVFTGRQADLKFGVGIKSSALAPLVLKCLSDGQVELLIR